MAEKLIKLKTKRLLISPATDEEIEALIEKEPVSELKEAYGEMLDGCKKDPQNRLWYTVWNIYLKKDSDKVVGRICFKGPQKRGAVEIGYGTNEGYENQGYMTEALRAVTEWTFNQKDVYIIYAETEGSNKASQKVLEKLSFKECGNGDEGVRFKLEKESASWMIIYMLFGLSMGMSLGTSFGAMPIGMCIGIGIGLVVGYFLDKNEKKHRKSITGTDEEDE